jgi:DNA invertase Pin-like site-specific DNA recombinase
MRIWAYLRVSRDGQDTNHQRLAILEFAHKEKMQIDDFVEVEISSRRSREERRLDFLSDSLKEGDTLIVSELSRLGRSLGEVVALVDDLHRRKIKFVAIKEKIHLADKYDMQSKVAITFFSLFAELERDLNSMRTKEALAALKREGKRLGRPKGIIGKSRLDGKECEISKLVGLKVSKTSIARIMEVDRSTLLNFMRSRKLVPIITFKSQIP